MTVYLNCTLTEDIHNMRMLIINPGSTSTKISIYENEKCIAEESVFHDAPVLMQFDHVNKQVPMRKQVVLDFLRKNRFDLSDVDVFVGRGGSAVPVRSGVIEINDLLYKDTRDAKGGSEHPAKLGVMLAYEFSRETGKPAYTMDPTNVDELCDEARITGMQGIYRSAQAHVLNQKAVARTHCKLHGLKYEETDLIVAHIDGGITVHAHRHGRMIDGNVGSGGDGAFSPTRIGSIPVLRLLDYIDENGTETVRAMCSRSGGLVSFFGTSDFRKVYNLVLAGDEKAVLVYNSMIYQICKEIGAMAAVLKGRVDGILLTGGLMIYDDIINKIRESCGWISEIFVYPGELEQEALAHQTLKALKGEKEILIYDGVPPFRGYPFIDDLS